MKLSLKVADDGSYSLNDGLLVGGATRLNEGTWQSSEDGR